jgi:hypothetical protein
MKRKQFSEEQIIGLLKEAEAGAVVTELCRKHGMSSATYYAWKAKYGGLEVGDDRRLGPGQEGAGMMGHELQPPSKLVWTHGHVPRVPALSASPPYMFPGGAGGRDG